jgi:hypothetical protein
VPLQTSGVVCFPISRVTRRDREKWGAVYAPALHGTRTMYSYGCRCDDCRRARRDGSRDYRKRLRVGLVSPKVKPVPEHGTLARYRNKYKCRCELCCAVQAKYNREYRENNRDRILAFNRYSHFGLTRSGYEALLEEQGGLCAICRLRAAVAVDHDHDTGGVRGLLCKSCNSGIGLLQDSVEVLESAADYLRTEKGVIR